MGRVAVYFEAAAVIISLTLLGQILELKARSQTSAAIKSLLGLAPKTARRIAATAEGRRAAGARACRRPAARAARREGARRRRRGRGQQRARRVDAHRRAPAGDQARGRQADRRHAEHQRRAGDASEHVGSATVLSQIVQMVAMAQRSRAPMQRMADVGGGLLRLWRRGGRAFDLLRLGPVRARAELGLRPDQCRGGADHRLPLRAGPGHTDVDHGRHRPRRHARRAVPRRGGDREPAQDRYPDRRQDRDADRREAQLRAGVGANGFDADEVAAPGRQPRPGQRASAGRGHRDGSAGEAARARQARAVRFRFRHRRARHGRRQGAGVGQYRADGATRRRRGA
jgi:hypothetical protein